MRGRGHSGQAIKLFQVPRKISFTFRLWHKFFVLDDVKLAELSNISFQWQNVTFLEVKTYCDPSYIFSSGQDPPNPQDLCPCLRVVCSHPAQISTDSSTPCFPPFSIRLMVSFITVDTYINCCRSVEPTTIRHSGIRLYRLSGKLSIKRVYRVVAL